jgi:hypothetical protein
MSLKFRLLLILFASEAFETGRKMNVIEMFRQLCDSERARS